MRIAFQKLGRIAAIAALGVALAGAASADIAKFNAAVTKRDYAAAAAEAKATWPTLDQDRSDIAVIAQEFGFASYMAKDYEQAKVFGTFVAGDVATAAADPKRSSGLVLLRAAEVGLSPKSSTRPLATALQAKLQQKQLDMITLMATQTLVSDDFKDARWKLAKDDAAMAVQLTALGGEPFLELTRRFELMTLVSEFLDTYKRGVYMDARALRDKLVQDIDGAPSDERARQFVPVYWETRAWTSAMESALLSRGGEGVPGELDSKREQIADRKSAYPKRAVMPGNDEDLAACPIGLAAFDRPNYPSEAQFKGIVGAVLLSVDLDAEGKASNPEILAATPLKHFGDPVLKKVPTIRMRLQPTAAANCSVARKGYVIEFTFRMR